MASSWSTAFAPSQIAEQEVKFYVGYNLREARKLPSPRMPAAHQSAALGKLRSWFASSVDSRGGLMVLPTGGGKTFTAIRFLCQGPLAQGYKVRWRAHTHQLLEQAFRELGPQDESQQSALGHIPEPREILRVRVVSGTEGHFRVAGIEAADNMVIATIQTICKAFSDKTRGDGHPNLMRFLDSCDGKLCVVFDEAHHAPSPSYRRFIEALRIRYPKLRSDQSFLRSFGRTNSATCIGRGIVDGIPIGPMNATNTGPRLAPDEPKRSSPAESLPDVERFGHSEIANQNVNPDGDLLLAQQHEHDLVTFVSCVGCECFALPTKSRKAFEQFWRIVVLDSEHHKPSVWPAANH